jgi:hypothetical protein
MSDSRLGFVSIRSCRLVGQTPYELFVEAPHREDPDGRTVRVYIPKHRCRLDSVLEAAPFTLVVQKAWAQHTDVAYE